MKNFMFFVVLLITSSVRACMVKSREKEEKRIVGGSQTTIEDVPYTLQMERYDYGKWFYTCTAVIYDENFVLTAAHCMPSYSPLTYRFRSGSKDRGQGKLHKAVAYAKHEQYYLYAKLGFAVNDIAVLQVKPKFEFSETTKPVPLVDERPKPGTKAVASGWGRTNHTDLSSIAPILKRDDLSILSHEECVKIHEKEKVNITEGMICAIGKNSGVCQGDSGGPLVAHGKLAGLSSFGGTCGSYPGVYADVNHYKPWLNATLFDWFD